MIKEKLMHELQNVAYYDTLVKEAEERKLERAFFFVFLPYWKERLYYSQVRMEAFDFMEEKYPSDELTYYTEEGKKDAYALIEKLKDWTDDVDLIYY